MSVRSLLLLPFVSVALLGACTREEDTAEAEGDSSGEITDPLPSFTVAISPLDPRTNDALLASVSAADPADDPPSDTATYSYAWFVNGAAVGNDAATLDGTTAFDKGDVVEVVVTLNESGVAGEQARSEPVTVGNSAPSAPLITLTPEDAVAGDALICSVSVGSVDDDGDALTYAFDWTVGGVVYASTANSATESIVDGSAVSAGQNWVCTVHAIDDLAVGPAASVALTTGVAGCIVGVVLDGLPYGPYALGETAIGGEVWYAGEVTAVGIQASNGRLDNLEISDGAGAAVSSDFASPEDWTWASGGICGVSFAGGEATSTSDWAYVAYTPTALDPQDWASVTVDTFWASTTNSFATVFIASPSMGDAGCGGYGPTGRLSVRMNHNLYASGTGPSQLEVSAYNRDGLWTTVYDTSFPVPAAGSGWHTLEITTSRCD